MSFYIEKMQAISRPDQPIELAEIKSFLRIEHEADDELLGDLARAAVEYLEDEISCALIQRKWRVVFSSIKKPRLRLPIGPAVAVSSVAIRSYNGQLTPLDPEQYGLCGDYLQLHFVPSGGVLEVVYVAGQATGGGDLLPKTKALLLDMVAEMYDGRGCEEIIRSERVTRLRRYLL